jgi:hypothetical protein
MTEILTPELLDLVDEDFGSFMEEIIKLPNADFHEDIDSALANKEIKKIVVTLPRGHGKSTHISVGFPLWLIARNHNIRILLISSTAAISRSFMSETINHIERNERYQVFAKYVEASRKGVIPKMKNYTKANQNWSGDSIVIDRTLLQLKDPTIHAVGLFGSILSKRADIIICDDIVNQENSQTEEQRAKIIDWIYTTVMPVLAPHGRFVYLGNTWHQDDLVSHLLKDPQFEYKKKMPAIQSWPTRMDLWSEWSKIIMDEEKSLDDRKYISKQFYTQNEPQMLEGLSLLWPGRFTFEELYLEYIANPYAFARMRQCDPSNRPSQKFKDEWLELAIKKGKDLKLQDNERTEFIRSMTTCGVDLAIGEKEWNDDTCIFTLDKVKSTQGDIKAGDVVIRQIDVGKFSPDEVRQKIILLSETVRPSGIRVENVGYQQAIVRDLEHKVANIRGYHTGGEKHDSTIGVNSLAILAEQGKLIIPYAQDSRTQKIVNRLLNELRAFPDGHTGDILMAFWFAHSEMRDLSGGKVLIPIKEFKMAHPVESYKELQDPVKLKEAEKIADKELLNQQAERNYEKQMFKQLMRGPRRNY